MSEINKLHVLNNVRVKLAVVNHVSDGRLLVRFDNSRLVSVGNEPGSVLTPAGFRKIVVAAERLPLAVQAVDSIASATVGGILRELPNGLIEHRGNQSLLLSVAVPAYAVDQVVAPLRDPGVAFAVSHDSMLDVTMVEMVAPAMVRPERIFLAEALFGRLLVAELIELTQRGISSRRYW